VHCITVRIEPREGSVKAPSQYPENVFVCSRHQRLVTVVFRRCVQINLLTYLLTHLNRMLSLLTLRSPTRIVSVKRRVRTALATSRNLTSVFTVIHKCGLFDWGLGVYNQPANGAAERPM